MYFKKIQVEVQVLLDFDSKVNAMTLAYSARLSFKIEITYIEAQKN